MKRYRKNLTESHIKVLLVVGRLINATVKALCIVFNSTTEKHYRGYLNDLALDGFLYKKTVYGIAQTGKNGIKLGTLYALTPQGAEMLKESQMVEGEIYHYKNGIKAKSPMQVLHRIQLIHILALLLQEEKKGLLQVLGIIPYFQKQGALVLGESKATATAQTENGSIIPDALVKVLIGGKVRVIAFELHRVTPTTRILLQLARHTEAIENNEFSTIFGESVPSFVCSIHEQESTIKNTIQRIEEIEDFSRYNKGFHFTTLDDLFLKGFEKAFYLASKEPSKLFSMSDK